MIAARSNASFGELSKVNWGYILWAVLFAGCAGASATTRSQVSPISSTVPSQIVVYPFAVSSSDVTLNQSIVQKTYRQVAGTNVSTSQVQLGEGVAQEVCDGVVEGLKKNGWNAACQRRGTPVYANNVLIVDGAFTAINEGNRLRRTVIGFGAGASTLDSSVQLYQYIRRRPHLLLDFTAHADSGKMPGAALFAPAGVAAGAGAGAVAGTNVAMAGAKGYRSSMSSLADMMASQTVNQLGNYFKQLGWSRNESDNS